jgi:outer membrane protein assembly factor BamB
MNQYLGADDVGEVKVTQSFDSDQFGELEVLGAFIQMNDVRSNWWEGVGYGGSITGRATFSDDRVFFGACDKIVYCLDNDGKEVWRFKTNDVVLEGPAVADDKVFISSTDFNVYCVDKSNGTEIWRFAAKDKIVEKPLYHEGRLYVGGCLDNNFYCLDADTGEEIWRFFTSDCSSALPLIYDNRIYFGYGGNKLHCLDLDGNLIWTAPTRDTIAAWPPAVRNGKLYIGSWDCNLYCIDAKTGQHIWKFQVPDPAMSPVIWNDVVCFSCWDNNAYCVDAETGKQVWKIDVNGFPGGLTTVCDGFFFVGSTDNNVYAIDIENGRKAWKFNTNGFVAQAASFNGRVYAGSWDCNLYCIDGGSGKLIWKFRTSIGSPSKITLPSSYNPKSAEVVWRPESEEEKKKYVGGGNTGDYDLSMSQYGVMDKSYVSEKKKGYVK